MATRDYEAGRDDWGDLNAVLAITDVVPVKALAIAVTKFGLWGTTRVTVSNVVNQSYLYLVRNFVRTWSLCRVGVAKDFSSVTG
jgi:hypothetical protein